jgi:hypothetical protein
VRTEECCSESILACVFHPRWGDSHLGNAYFACYPLQGGVVKPLRWQRSYDGGCALYIAAGKRAEHSIELYEGIGWEWGHRDWADAGFGCNAGTFAHFRDARAAAQAYEDQGA